MKHLAFALVLAAFLAVPAARAGGHASTSTHAAAAKEDASQVQNLQQQLHDIDQKLSALRTDDTKIDAASKMTPEARAQAVKEAKAAVQKCGSDISDAVKGKKVNSSHAKSFQGHLADCREYLDGSCVAGSAAKSCGAAAKKSCGAAAKKSSH
jgi:hypothetical protein